MWRVWLESPRLRDVREVAVCVQFFFHVVQDMGSKTSRYHLRGFVTEIKN